MKIIIPVLCLAAACHSGENVGFTGEGSRTFEIAAALPTPLDVLVVLDDTTAMASHLPRVPDPANLGGVLEAIYNGAPDLRIAVTTTTTGTRRVSAAVPTGVVVHARNFEDGSWDKNYTGSLASALSSLMNVGATSTSPNAVIASTQLALDDSFVRESSSVGILMVSASDDQSTEDVAAYAEAIQAKGNPALVSAVYSGPALRLAAFVDAFAYRHVVPIESFNMEAISIFAQLFDDVTSDGCLPLAAAQASNDGDLLDCDLFTSHNDVVHPLPMCSGSAWEAAAPCWQTIADTSCSSDRAILFGGGYRIYHPRIEGNCGVH
jgi:hypothetical protein